MALCRKLAPLIFGMSILSDSFAFGASLSPPILQNVAGQFILTEPEMLVPAVPLRANDGNTVTLADYRGKVLILNFWASWCRPCIAELPSLELLASSMPADRLAVAAVSLDRTGDGAAEGFLARNRLDHISVLFDPDRRLGDFEHAGLPASILPIYGLPTTYIVDRTGYIAGYLSGPLDWNSPQARMFVEYFIDLK